MVNFNMLYPSEKSPLIINDDVLKLERGSGTLCSVYIRENIFHPSLFSLLAKYKCFVTLIFYKTREI